MPMDIFEYLFIHSQRLPDRDLLRKPINKKKYTSRSKHATIETVRDNHTNDLTAEEDEDGDPRRDRKLYQRELGLFHKLVVRAAEGDKSTVTCTCENFRRYGKCEDSELMGFICLEGKSGQPTDDNAVDFNDCKEGYDVVSKRLRAKVLSLVDAKCVCIQAPPKDPSEVLQDAPIVQSNMQSS